MAVRHLRSLPTGPAVAIRAAARPAENDRTPEPARLYHLITLAFIVHTRQPGNACTRCGTTWPCPQVRLAYRLREGF